MPLHGRRDRRWVSAVAAIATAGLVVTACTSGGDSSPRAERTRQAVPRGPADVRAPSGTDRVLPGPALEADPFTAPAKQPNLLMITTDDAASKDMKYMPHVQDLLAEQGVTLTDGLAPTPICVPARASLLSGQYAHNHGALTISGEGGGFSSFEDDDTLPVWLQRAGYDTMFLGKYLNGYGEDGSGTYVPPGWTDWRATVDPTTYNFVRPTLNINGTEQTFSQYSTDLLRDQSLDLLDDPARQQAPWYMWVNYVAPHHGGPDAPDDPSRVHPDNPTLVKTTTPAPRDVDSFSDLRLPRTPDMFESDTSDKAIIGATHKKISKVTREDLTEARQQRIEALQDVDRSVARTVRTLRRTGQLKNTYIVFTSDNGYVLGEHNLTGKLWYFREIAGIPMYARGPGIAKGSTSATPVTNADWAPTFAALAGATPTRDVDGTNVLPWLDTGAERRVVPIEGYPVKGGRRPLYTGVIVGPWTFVKGRGKRSELYYRDVDPWQLDNLRRDERYRGKLKKLRSLWKEYVDCAGSTCASDFYR